MRLLVFAASLRSNSLNVSLARLTADYLAARGVEVDLASFSEFDAPSYNQDLLDNSGFPRAVGAFIERLRAADGFAIASPEYAFSVPGMLKNLIDWSSQDEPIAWTDKPGLLLSASVSSMGGQRGLAALRIPLEALGAQVYPDMFSVPTAHEKLDSSGQLTDTGVRARLHSVIDAFLAFAQTVQPR